MNIKKFNEDVKKFLPNFQIKTVLGYDEKADEERTMVNLVLDMSAVLEPKDATPEYLVVLVQKQLEDIVRFSALVAMGDPNEAKEVGIKKSRTKKV